MSLHSQLVFYGSYHHHPVNQFIHFIFVPLIMFSALVWMAYFGPIVHADTSAFTQVLPSWMASSVVLNPGLAVVTLYSAIYIFWDVIAGATWMLFLAVPMWLCANWFQAHVGNAWAWALGMHVLSWYMQIHPGHLVFEKRKPSLMDSFVQAFLTAPLFVWFEMLFVLGYRPKLRSEVNTAVEANIAAFHAHESTGASVDAHGQPLLSDE